MSFWVTSFTTKENEEPQTGNEILQTSAADEECVKESVDSAMTKTDNEVEISEDNIANEHRTSKKVSHCITCWTWWCGFYSNNSFIILVIAALLLARAYPPLGAVYVYPKITASYVALIIIFLLAGISLKTKALKNAVKHVGFNIFVQVFSFGIDSSIVFGFATFLRKVGAISDALATGLIICGCLSVTVNMVFVLTKSAGGDEAVAVFHAAFGNFVGVFLTPLLILFYVGKNASVDIGTTYFGLFIKVILPVLVGQLLQYCVPVVAKFADKNKASFKMIQEWALVFIVYTTFSQTFYSGQKGASVGEIFIMIAMVFVILVLLMVFAWYTLKLLFHDEPKLRVMGLFGCTQKTVAVGVPLIKALYQNDPMIGLYTLPILMWHPMQLFIGTWLAPYLAAFVARETERLKREQTCADVSPGSPENCES